MKKNVSDNVECWAVDEYAPWITVAPGDENAFPTTHLPDKVVKHPFIMAIDCRTLVDNPRLGGCWFNLNFDDRMNPGDLTADEKEYILGMVRGMLDRLPGTEAGGS